MKVLQVIRMSSFYSNKPCLHIGIIQIFVLFCPYFDVKILLLRRRPRSGCLKSLEVEARLILCVPREKVGFDKLVLMVAAAA